MPLRSVVLLAGGLGGARLAPALAAELGPGVLTVVANVGDDLDWMGLRVCPDLDSITYALAGLWHRERGWGRLDETFVVRDSLAAIGAPNWFGVGDRDLALHLERSRRLRDGATLTEATRAIAGGLGVSGATVLPASDAPSPTRIRLRDGRTLDFQEWYVRERAEPEVAETLLSSHAASPVVLAALVAADTIVLGPSNPVTSIGAILALDGMKAALGRARLRIAVSPVVAGARAPSPSIEHHSRARARVLAAAGLVDRPGSIAGAYRGVVDRFVIDAADRTESDGIRDLGIEPVVADVLDDRALARSLREAISTGE
jgi:LPPG:FO 2-phospho-L-lactate transferase